MKIINSYSKFVANKPFLVLIFSLIASAFMLYQLSSLQMVNMDYEDILPEDLEVMQGMNILKEDFGGNSNAMVVVELDNLFFNSNEPTDVRDPRIIKYIDLLSQKINYVDYVESVESISYIIKKANSGYVPNSLSSIKNILENSYYYDYVSSDATMSLIKIKLNEDSAMHAKEIEKQLQDILDQTSKPSGISVKLAGETVKHPILQKLTGKDMNTTSFFSLLGIVLILLFVFRSFKDGLLPLTTIIFGVVWALGFTSLIGMGISSMTSGVISMIMGIGIDFGIQVITRFKQELKTKDKRKAMENTLNNIFVPMLVTTLSALIGFRAMSLGQLKMMGEMGTIMSFGVVFCMTAAVTVVPSLLILLERKK